jgi:hypothetical protein
MVVMALPATAVMGVTQGFQRCAIGMHGTGTTQAGTAAEFGAFQLELVTYHP